ncbi:hypothetical protein V8B97DRAFT_1954021 [Scleroderma yunnanense]
MCDTVEEEVRACLRLVCQSFVTYVHCKVGRSRSVAIVMAYRIHAHHYLRCRCSHDILVENYDIMFPYRE